MANKIMPDLDLLADMAELAEKHSFSSAATSPQKTESSELAPMPSPG
jgi:hypothetical protein